MQHDFQIIIVPEYLLVPFNCLFRSIQIASEYVLRDFSSDAGRRAYQILVIFLQHFVRHSWLAIIKTIRVSFRHDFHQVLIAIVVLGEQDQVIVALTFLMMIVVPRDINLATDDWLHLVIAIGIFMLSGEFQELFHSIHIAMVRYGQGRHAHLFCSVEQGFYGR